MRKIIFAAVVAAMGCASVAHAAPLTFGDLFVTRVGTGTSALTSASTAVFVDEYTTTGSLVQSIALPTVVSGSNQELTASGTATSEFGLTLSSNGKALVLAGYDTAPGTAAVAGTSTATVKRTIGVISTTGAIDTKTTTTSYSGNNVRDAYLNGSNIYIAGPTNGISEIALDGSGAATQLSATQNNLRRVELFNGQLYISSGSGSQNGVDTVGTGIPTTAGQTINRLPGVVGTSPYDFEFLNSNTLYVTDDTTSGSGGVQKYDFNGTSWVEAYTGLATVSGSKYGFRGLSIDPFQSTPTDTVMYGIGANSGGTTGLFRVTDNGSALSFTEIAAAPTNTAFRGITVLIPESDSFLLVSLGLLPITAAFLARRRKK